MADTPRWAQTMTALAEYFNRQPDSTMQYCGARLHGEIAAALRAQIAQADQGFDACENCQNGRDCSRWDCASVAALGSSDFDALADRIEEVGIVSLTSEEAHAVIAALRAKAPARPTREQIARTLYEQRPVRRDGFAIPWSALTGILQEVELAAADAVLALYPEAPNFAHLVATPQARCERCGTLILIDGACQLGRGCRDQS